MIDSSSTQVDRLSSRLRSGTQELHRAAERAGLMARLLRGDIDAASYATLLAGLHTIYEALEQGLSQHADDAALGRFGFAALRRAPALAGDLQALPAVPRPLPTAARRYAERLQRLAAQEPGLLVAHAYVRYLGDLHGGQLLRRIVEQALQLDGRATRFYDFGTPAQVAAAIVRFRAALDALVLDAPQAQALVDEARWAFEQHVALFDELAAG